MKRLVLLVASLLTLGVAAAQNYIVVDSEKIFKSLAEYNEAIAELDKLAKSEQESVDKKFAEVEQYYNAYMQVRSSLDASTQQKYENQILALEKQATQYQESIFGESGSLMKRRLEMVQPIQRRVFSAIESVAKSSGADLVLDKASNPSLLYNSQGVDKTEAVITYLKSN